MPKGANPLEVRVKMLEDAVKMISSKLELDLELADALGADPFDYARDDTDRKIIDYLLTKGVATATEIKKEANIQKIGRQAIGKRLQRMVSESDAIGLQWLKYNAKRVQNHFRAWWLIEHNIKPNILQKYEKMRDEADAEIAGTPFDM
jgi:hypothetical protein